MPFKNLNPYVWMNTFSQPSKSSQKNDNADITGYLLVTDMEISSYKDTNDC